MNIRKAKSYLDWLELVDLKEKENLKEILEVNFYNKNSKWLLKLAEEDIGTVDDLNNYINWIGNNEQ